MKQNARKIAAAMVLQGGTLRLAKMQEAMIAQRNAARVALQTYAKLHWVLSATRRRERFAIERCGVTAADIKFFDGSTVVLWNRRRIDMADHGYMTERYMVVGPDGATTEEI